MGILKREQENIFIRNGFEYVKRNCIGTLDNCYEKAFPLSNLYWAWVSVDPLTSRYVVYIEYECGGEIGRYESVLASNFDADEEEFYKELDREVTLAVNLYT